MSGDIVECRNTIEEVEIHGEASGSQTNLNTMILPRDMLTSFRAGGPKSRGGCITCKIRRIKCGEEKPFCKRCVSTGRTCDGYAPKKPLKKKSRSRSPKETSTETTPPPTRSAITQNPSIHIGGSPSERRSFHYFQSQGFSRIAGNFEPYFWNNVILQFTHIYPTVQQSLLALSAIYEERSAKGSIAAYKTSGNEYVLRQYTKAVKALVEYLSSGNQDPRVTLISCLLFVWVEVLQRDVEAGFRHLYSGLKILVDLRENGKVGQTEQTDLGDIYEMLSRSFTRLTIQASMHGSTTDEIAKTCPQTSDVIRVIPQSFANIFEARICLDNDFKAIFGYFRRIREQSDNFNRVNRSSDNQSFAYIRQAHILRLEQWKKATEEMIAGPANYYSVDSSEYLYLQIYYTMVTTLLDINPGSEMVFDAHTPAFERLVALAEMLVLRGDTSTQSLSLDMGIIPPLFYVGIKCRVLRVRQRAVELLALAPEQEGLWIRDDIRQILQWKIDIEESGRGEDARLTDTLPVWARITNEHIAYDERDSKTYVRYTRGPHPGEIVSVEFDEKMKFAEMLGNLI